MTAPDAVSLSKLLSTQPVGRLPLQVALGVAREVARLTGTEHDLSRAVTGLSIESVKLTRDGRVVLDVSRAPAGDLREDIRAVGEIIYRLLTGQGPGKGEPVAPSHFNPGVDGELDAVVLASLAADPDARPGSVRALEESLSGIFEELELEPDIDELAYLVRRIPEEPKHVVRYPVAVAAPKPVAVAAPKPVAVAAPKPVAVAAPKPVAVAVPKPVAAAAPKPAVKVAAPAPKPAPVAAVIAKPRVAPTVLHRPPAGWGDEPEETFSETFSRPYEVPVWAQWQQLTSRLSEHRKVVGALAAALVVVLGAAIWPTSKPSPRQPLEETAAVRAEPKYRAVEEAPMPAPASPKIRMQLAAASRK